MCVSCPIFFYCADEVREVGRGPRAHSMIQPFTIEKLQFCFAKMRSNKCADSQSLIFEMFKEGGPVLWQTLIDFYNKVVVMGQLAATWRNAFFTMIFQKIEDVSAPGIWKPIATLQIAYTIFTKLLHHRLKECVEGSQSPDQFGFRPGMTLEHALFVFESVTEKSLEFGFGFGWRAWIYERHLTKIMGQLCLQHSTDKGFLKNTFNY